MGEYHTLLTLGGGVHQVCKLGTCDDWRYCRYEEAQKLAPLDAGISTDIPAALATPGTLWRFPWPDEDHATVPDIDQREMFRTVLWTCPELECEHQTRCVSVHPEGLTSGYNVNVWIPCPREAAAAGLKTSPVAPLFNIYGERYQAGQARTIFRCAWCGQPFSFSAAELTPVIQALQHEADLEARRNAPSSAQFYRTLAERLRPR